MRTVVNADTPSIIGSIEHIIHALRCFIVPSLTTLQDDLFGFSLVQNLCEEAERRDALYIAIVKHWIHMLEHCVKDCLYQDASQHAWQTVLPLVLSVDEHFFTHYASLIAAYCPHNEHAPETYLSEYLLYTYCLHNNILESKDLECKKIPTAAAHKPLAVILRAIRPQQMAAHTNVIEENAKYIYAMLQTYMPTVSTRGYIMPHILRIIFSIGQYSSRRLSMHLEVAQKYNASPDVLRWIEAYHPDTRGVAPHTVPQLDRSVWEGINTARTVYAVGQSGVHVVAGMMRPQMLAVYATLIVECQRQSTLQALSATLCATHPDIPLLQHIHHGVLWLQNAYFYLAVITASCVGICSVITPIMLAICLPNISCALCVTMVAGGWAAAMACLAGGWGLYVLGTWLVSGDMRSIHNACTRALSATYSTSADLLHQSGLLPHLPGMVPTATKTDPLQPRL